jgi:ariadne-1
VSDNHALPPTPVTTASNPMDSDEEYMSALSSDDELMQDDSGDEMSAGDGNLSPLNNWYTRC